MRSGSLSPTNIKFIEANRLKMSGSAMAKIFGVGRGVVNRFMQKNGLSAPLELQIQWRGEGNIGKTTSTPKLDRILIKHYLTTNVNQLAQKIKRSETFVKGRLRQLNLVISQDIIDQRKRDSQIKPGHVPLNKGKKQEDYMSAEAITRTKDTRFKKGQLPKNTKSDLTISIRADKRGVNYKFIRVSLAKWIPLHRYNWITENGKIPAKKKLIFKDGNPMNCAVENLELLTAAELMKRNSYHNNYPKEVALVIQLSGALTRQINKRIKTIAK